MLKGKGQENGSFTPFPLSPSPLTENYCDPTLSVKDKIVNVAVQNIRGFTSVTLKELEQQLLALSPGEKVQAIQLLAQSLGMAIERNQVA